jgi:SAM-dependent methyltransferase
MTMRRRRISPARHRRRSGRPAHHTGRSTARPATAPDAAYFDRWYGDIADSAGRVEVASHALGLPPELESTGLVPWDGIADVVGALGLAPGAIAVDLGCGRGGYALEVARRTGARMIGVDFSAVAIARARETAAGRAEFVVGELARTGLDDHCADAVMCLDAMQFAEPYRAGLAECARILVPGGRLALTGWEALDLSDEEIPARLRRDIGAELRAARFTGVEVRHMPVWREAELTRWRRVLSEPPGDDPAMRSIHAEGTHAMGWLDRSRRVLATARATGAV